MKVLAPPQSRIKTHTPPSGVSRTGTCMLYTMQVYAMSKCMEQSDRYEMGLGPGPLPTASGSWQRPD